MSSNKFTNGIYEVLVIMDDSRVELSPRIRDEISGRPVEIGAGLLEGLILRNGGGGKARFTYNQDKPNLVIMPQSELPQPQKPIQSESTEPQPPSNVYYVRLYRGNKKRSYQEPVLAVKNSIENGAGSVDGLVISGRSKLKNRERVKEERKRDEPNAMLLKQELFGLLTKRLIDLYGDDSWPIENALESKIGGALTPFKTLLYLFELRYEAKKQGRREPLGYFEEKVGLYASTINSIFRRQGIEPMIRTLSRPSQEQREAVLRLWETSLPAPDIGYFTNEYFETQFHKTTYNNILKERGTSRKIDELRLYGRTGMNFRLASQIYEAEDVFSESQQIAEYTGATIAQIDLAMRLKETLKPKIVKALRLLTRTEIDTPYLGSLRYRANK